MSDNAAASVRVRFAPSPTGYLHLGGVRTAIFNWLFARKHNGTFILRIDDTDRKRHQEEAVRIILEGMQWVGLDWDEGPTKEGAFGPYYQFERMDLYKAAAKKLEENGRAYWEKKEAKEVPEWKIKKLKKAGQWDEDQEKAAQDAEPALYFKMHEGEPAAKGFTDAVWGAYERPAEMLTDFVLMRADGTPTYNFASAVDDLQMKISHVIRGEDHMANTPKQIAVMEALDKEAAIPTFAHLPMIHNDKKQKMSKRRDVVSLTFFRKAGIFPEALFNYMSLLGWSPGDDREVMSKEELLEAFSLERVKQSPAQFSLKRKSDIAPDASDEERVRWLNESLPGSKLEWINGEYLMKMTAATLAEQLKPFLAERGCDLSARPEAWQHAVVEVIRERARTLSQAAEKLEMFFKAPTAYDPKSVKKVLLKNDGLAVLKAVREVLGGIQAEDWSSPNLEETVKKFVEEKELKFGHVAQPLRVGLSGNTVSPPIHDTLALLGREDSLERLDRALEQDFSEQ